MNALIDTCVIIDALQSREPFRPEAEAIFLAVANRRVAGCITANSVTDIYYLMHKALHSAADTKKALGILFSLFDIIDTCGIDCRKALASDTADYEDAVMIESAIRADIDCIVTRNTKDYAEAPLPVYTPSEFLKLLTIETEPDSQD